MWLLSGISIEVADGWGGKWRLLCLCVLLHVDPVREHVARDRVRDGHGLGSLEAWTSVLCRSLSGFDTRTLSLSLPDGFSKL